MIFLRSKPVHNLFDVDYEDSDYKIVKDKAVIYSMMKNAEVLRDQWSMYV